MVFKTRNHRLQGPEVGKANHGILEHLVPLLGRLDLDLARFTGIADVIAGYLSERAGLPPKRLQRRLEGGTLLPT